ncbi:SRPBCC family protein [Sediminitomix flava]|uniref:Polyketide cyclase/dehydrase/lipid transport protein n=1 Tax=Sediminitomix flava TaxID=379075 RepID=A0A315ZBN0_SEDFL|nr:SRPBCC family protein [Sediminitomix flava]PWJ42770.1 polyketide cyclase/dehydrase/lipid transport protein [Sediminitomix flava]
MKTLFRSSIIILLSLITTNVMAQKKVKTLSLSKVIDFPAQKLWQIVGEDYGSVAYSHPRIIDSDYVNGSLKAEEGAERVCYFNDSHSQFLKEKIVNYNPEEMSFTNQVFQAGKFPVDPEYTKGVYRIEDLGNGQSKMHFDMQFRTKPAIMGALMKGSFKKLIEDYFIALEYHIKTGEKVTKENFKSIKKKVESGILNKSVENTSAKK